jgi:hypothetical protein
MAATPIRIAYRRTPRLGEMAELFIEYNGTTVGELRVRQEGATDLYRGPATPNCYITVVAVNEKPIQAELMLEGNRIPIGAPVMPIVPKPIIRRIRVTRVCLPGKSINGFVETTAMRVTAQLVKDRDIEEKSVAGTDRFIFRPTTSGWHIVRITAHNFNVSTTATRRVFVGALSPRINLDREIQSGREGALVTFAWKVRWADNVWLEHDRQREKVEPDDSRQLRVPSEGRLIATGPGGTTTKFLGAVPWLFHDLLGGGHD